MLKTCPGSCHCGAVPFEADTITCVDGMHDRLEPPEFTKHLCR